MTPADLSRLNRAARTGQALRDLATLPDPARTAFARSGALAKNAALTPEQRSAVARRAARARWSRARTR